MLLLEYVDDDGSRRRNSYLLSDLNQTVSDMLPGAREWVLSVLTDIVGAQFDSNLSTDEMFGWYSSLDVGPLRTTCAGCFSCISLSEAFASIKEKVMSQTWSQSEDGCFPDLLLPIDNMTLRSVRTQRKCQSSLQRSS